MSLQTPIQHAEASWNDLYNRQSTIVGRTQGVGREYVVFEEWFEGNTVKYYIIWMPDGTADAGATCSQVKTVEVYEAPSFGTEFVHSYRAVMARATELAVESIIENS